jgi:hypothetical protein
VALRQWLCCGCADAAVSAAPVNIAAGQSAAQLSAPVRNILWHRSFNAAVSSAAVGYAAAMAAIFVVLSLWFVLLI